ncbi:MAG: hypothetical protein HY423_06500 [Candidatus Lambdaproteobacteria bacterium]|nr:hypothetical protein [Candidatus Lambdaproteobacteria bacterium]
MIPEQITAFRDAYGPWLTSRRPILDQRRWKEAFVGFPVLNLPDIPFTPLAKPLREARLGMLTTAGLYLRGEHQPFDAANIEGDPSFRELPLEAGADRLGIAHEHYDHASAEQDLNVVYPVLRLMELVAQGEIGSVSPLAMSTSGYCTRLDRIAEETAPRIAARVKELRIDALLHIPV